ncbi:hypothetical protein NL676_019897 [Syzygium grande]|nr:hypothetical protein NL676_019897 [Syzygium grande]
MSYKGVNGSSAVQPVPLTKWLTVDFSGQIWVGSKRVSGQFNDRPTRCVINGPKTGSFDDIIESFHSLAEGQRAIVGRWRLGA